jgi:sulfoxide reductase heme-binding subunit YedZ
VIIAIKFAIWLLALSPLGWLIYTGTQNQLGPDPGKEVVDTLGLWALRLLLITLALRPLRELTGKAMFLRVRRLLGLFSWFYASLHLLAGFFYVIGWSWPELVRALDERTYILLGMLAWLLMVPLGLTSNRWAQRKMGHNWRRLHQLIYPLAILACLHFIWLVRSDYWEPALYATILAILLLWRWPLLRNFRLRPSSTSH